MVVTIKQTKEIIMDKEEKVELEQLNLYTTKRTETVQVYANAACYEDLPGTNIQDDFNDIYDEAYEHGLNAGLAQAKQNEPKLVCRNCNSSELTKTDNVHPYVYTCNQCGGIYGHDQLVLKQEECTELIQAKQSSLKPEQEQDEVDSTNAPEGYKAVDTLDTDDACEGCAFDCMTTNEFCPEDPCSSGERADGRDVVFIKIEEQSCGK